MIHIEKNGKVIGTGYKGRTYKDIAERIEKESNDLQIAVAEVQIEVSPVRGEDIIYSRQMRIISDVCQDEGVNFYATYDSYRQVPKIVIY